MGLFELILALSVLGTIERTVHHVTSKPKKAVLLELKELNGRVNQLETIAIGLDPLSKEIQALPERTT